VLKVNAQERYTTEIEASAHLKACAERAGVKLQTFVARSDKPTGSTIGPMTASRLGIRSVDIGTPMLSMHSIREMGGVEDQEMMVRLLREHVSE
jgi:aspartyl aminopeptidase